MYNPVLFELLVQTKVQEILANAEHDRMARQAPRRPSLLAKLGNLLPDLASASMIRSACTLHRAFQLQIRQWAG